MIFELWKQQVQKLVIELELVDPEYKLPDSVLYGWYIAGYTVDDAVYTIQNEGI